MTPRAVYLHVPFCVKRCHYCDFATDSLAYNPRVRRDRFDDYLTAVGREILAAEPRPIPTIFCGGGTPTVLAATDLLSLLDLLRESHGLLPDAEITVEANPTTAEADKFAALREGGVNRLSLGVQAFQPRLLTSLGRNHTVDEARRAVSLARQTGFDNLSLDLMFGLPTQTLADWRDSLWATVDLAPEHVSLYGLTVEPGTPLAERVATGRVRLLDEETEARMYELAVETLTAAGYEHYEISNFARPGRRSRHNQVYWRNEEYRGFGPGAASYVARRRWLNVPALPDYVARLAAGESPEVEAEVRDDDGERRETMYLGLRLLDGVAVKSYEQRYGVTPDELFPAELAKLTAQGLLERTASAWRLTQRGLLLANRVFLEFV